MFLLNIELTTSSFLRLILCFSKWRNEKSLKRGKAAARIAPTTEKLSNEKSLDNTELGILAYLDEFITTPVRSKVDLYDPCKTVHNTNILDTIYEIISMG